MIQRLVEKLGLSEYCSRLNGAYRRILSDHDGQLIVRDIVATSGLMNHTGETLTAYEAGVVEGKRVMAMHIIEHLDLSPEDLINAKHNALIEEFQLKQAGLEELNFEENNHE